MFKVRGATRPVAMFMEALVIVIMRVSSYYSEQDDVCRKRNGPRATGEGPGGVHDDGLHRSRQEST